MKTTETNFHIGCSGFYNAYWKGSLYPAYSQNKDFLKLYSQTFDIVEINSTFYRKPTVKTLQKWVDETPDDFKFFIKIPKTISHQKPFENKKEEILAFCNYIKTNLGKKLAGFLFQFPPSFHKTSENLIWLNENLPDDFLIVVEFRHNSWWSDDVLKIFKNKKWIFSGTSFPSNLPEDIIVTNPNVGYYRLHGKPTLYKSPYSEEFLNDLAGKIKKTKKEYYIMFNNTWGTAAVENSLYLKKILK
ncbi:DUF72 domain-containing protein [Epilithonimonas sp. JDS]|uniref:DUF72 domain-containing protein n=1 Tax=Epilithonimonas sp. JDS TaxID=2902797 RepID=UPI001E4BF8ED|nr:DUF72 domain-containing protein [Epilithonimonas sp. JDS]MCD9854646.1 DUF72 domain-containing protein [Epilithonimonas sp. JDS]